MVDYNCLLIIIRILSRKRFIYACVEDIELLKEKLGRPPCCHHQFWDDVSITTSAKFLDKKHSIDDRYR
jgi:hypothetical protein